MKLTLKELELLNTASAYNGEQHKAICGKAVLELIEYKKIEEELGLPLKIWIYLVQEVLIKEKRVYIENSIDSEEERQLTKEVNNGIDKRYILGVNFEKKKIYVQGEAFSPFYGMPFKDYGKTWALTKEELL